MATIMERTCWISRIASIRTFAKLAVLCALAPLGVWPCQGESLRGIVYANSSGASGSGTGIIRFAVSDNRIEDLYYSKPLKTQFRSPQCQDIGAIWSLELTKTMDVISAECDGKVDEWAHGSWLVIRDFLDRLSKGSPSSFDLFSARWSASSDSQQYGTQLKDLNFSTYLGGQCLQVVGIDRSAGTQIDTGADCRLRLKDQLVDVSFNVVRNKVTGRFEIDGMSFR